MPDVSRTLIQPEGRSVSVSKALESQKDSERQGAKEMHRKGKVFNVWLKRLLVQATGDKSGAMVSSTDMFHLTHQVNTTQNGKEIVPNS